MEITHLALDRHTFHGDRVEGYTRDYRLRWHGRNNDWLFQDAVRKHRLFPFSRPAGFAAGVHRMRDQERPQTSATPPPVNGRRLRGRPGRTARDRRRARALVCGRSRAFRRAPRGRTGTRLREDVDGQRYSVHVGGYRAYVPQQEWTRFLPQSRALARVLGQ